MKTQTRVLLNLGIATSVTLAAGQALAADFSFSDPGSVLQGDTFVVDLIVSGLASEDLGGFDLDISFDESLFTFNAYTLGTELEDAYYGSGDYSSGVTSSGIVNIAEVATLLDLSFQPDSFVIASLEFVADNVGLGEFTYAYIDTTDEAGLYSLPVNASDLSVDVKPVPVPGALILLVSGLLGIAGLRRNGAR